LPLPFQESELVIKGIKFASVPVRDQDRALAFYTQKLGFAVATDQPFDATQRWIELRIPGAETRLVLFTPPGWESRIGGFQNITFIADDVERTAADLAARGVELAGPVRKESWGSSATFLDPDGNTFVISTK
jgi:catechol 2,3-dioxygenase-like lactoylglutathione lyase family enzyme